MQTDIEVDEVLLADALAATGLETFRDVVELGLRMLITLNRPEETRGFPEASVPEVCLEGTGMEIVTTHLDPPTERAETIFEMLAEEEWISARAAPEGVAGWQQLGWIFGVEAASQLTLPDTSSMSAISRGRSSKRFAELGPVTDPWKIAACGFTFPTAGSSRMVVPVRSRQRMRSTTASGSLKPRAGSAEHLWRDVLVA
ncbi:type II toxin-antitoxin system VapB family antitoxin [Paraburkholderia sp. RL18-101-BIB-B]|uniref:type II toxin-antitoxin system VapB family antitoxin n=1 Tax=Paraburkholderia sp. RL18-101-BIB-B TaxID=3031634 RepID=UPI0038B7A4A2